MRRFAQVLISLLFLAAPLTAQDRGNTILVLDGSGSMWGQIDGVAKITIAQDVVTDLLQSLPADQNLGLTVYGHRTRGDCTDIETVVPPGPDTRAAIAAAVANIKPLGKTPMTDAVIAAADALRYTEDKATVILVSDGVETCNPDPCAAAALLEEAGIDFTVHVVGFDVGNDAEALAQMQCIADKTGGQFLTAANADELATALETVAAEPAIYGVTFRATEGEGGPDITSQVDWQMTDAAGQVNDWPAAEALGLDLNPGQYSMTAFWTSQEVQETVVFDVIDADMTVTVVFPVVLPTATLEAADSAAIGSEVAVTWTGPDDNLDNVQIGSADDGYVYDYEYTSAGNPLMVTMPTTPGTYELRYRYRDTTTIATRAIEVTPAEVSLTAPDTAPGGSTVDVTWVGPDASLDNITVSDQGDGTTYSYDYTKNGNPSSLVMPWDPGVYELRYMFGDKEIIATRLITVTPGDVSMDAPETAPLSSTISVTWTGPDAPSDTIQIGKPGDTSYSDYGYTSNGNPIELTMPSEPGDYELRYMFRDSVVIATRPITVTDVASGLTAPDTAIAGSEIQIAWQGPGNAQDFVGVGKIDDENYINYTYIRTDNPVPLQMPVEPGQYEIRYYLAADNTILSRRPITIEPLKVTLTSPAEAVAGASVAVAFDGADYPQDFIGVGKVGDDSYINYAYTSRGNPADLQMPVEPGAYEIRYYLNQDQTIVQRAPITITPLKVQLVAAATASLADAKVVVGYDGPQYAQDFIGIGPIGDDNYATYAYVRQDNPVEVDLPETVGSYEIRYYLGQDNTIVARLPLEVTK